MLTTVWLMLSSLLYSLQLQTGSFPKPLTAQEERHYLALAAQGDLEARNVLIERNLRLVAHIMKKYYTQTADQEDLISIGTIGLIKGISTFDDSKGVRLATYAARCVENEILMYFRSQRKSSQDVSLSDYIETGSDGAALSLMDVVAEEEDLLETISDRQMVRLLAKAVQTRLTAQERQVIVLRYGLGGKVPMRQREVADVTGISRSYVSRIEKRALAKLKENFEAKAFCNNHDDNAKLIVNLSTPASIFFVLFVINLHVMCVNIRIQSFYYFLLSISSVDSSPACLLSLL